MPDDIATGLLLTARHSFTQGLVVTTAISPALMIVTAIVGD